MIRKAIIVVLTLGAAGTGAFLAFILFDGDFVSGDFSRQYSHRLNAVAIGGYVIVEYTGPERTLWPDMDLTVGPIHLEMRHDPFGDGLGFPRSYCKAKMILIITSHAPLIFAGLSLLFAAYPALAFIRGPLRRYRRRKRGLCVRCGYDLTGLTEPRCPECGAEVGVP